MIFTRPYSFRIGSYLMAACMVMGGCSRRVLPGDSAYHPVSANGPLFTDANNGILLPIAAIIAMGILLWYGCRCALTNPKRNQRCN